MLVLLYQTFFFSDIRTPHDATNPGNLSRCSRVNYRGPCGTVSLPGFRPLSMGSRQSLFLPLLIDTGE